MKSIFLKTVITLFIVHFSLFITHAQISINEDGSSPDSSAILDVNSSDKGMLVPRMSSTTRDNINNPANGLMVFDTTTNTFWFFSTAWQEITDRDAQNLVLSQDSIFIDNGNGIDVSSLRKLNENGLQLVDTIVEAGLDVVQEVGNNTHASDYMSQSFTPTKTGNLTQIDLRLVNTSFFNLGELRIYQGSATTGTLIYQGVIQSMATPWHSFDLSNENIYLTAGTLYTFAIEETNDITFSMRYNYTNPYSGGSADVSNADYVFKTYYESTIILDQSIIGINLNSTNAATANINSIDTIFFADGTHQITADTDKQTIDTFRLDGNNLELSLENDKNTASVVDLSAFLDNTDNQELTFSNNVLSISNGFNIIDLSDYQQNLSLSNDDLSISDGNDVSLSSYKQSLGLSNDNLSISNGNNVSLSNYKQTLSLSNDNLSISNGNNVSLSNYKQTLSLSNDILSISNGNTVDLSRAFVSSNGITYGANNSDDFIFGSTNTLNHTSGTENKFFFDRGKGAFRAGAATGTDWDAGNLGNYSVALGFDGIASGTYSVALGYQNDVTGGYSIGIGVVNNVSSSFSLALGQANDMNASNTMALGIANDMDANGGIAIGDENDVTGINAIAIGTRIKAASYSEIALGIFSTTYTPDNTNGFDNDDRILTVGNGTAENSRSDALRIFKDGKSFFYGEAAGDNDFVMTIDNTLNSNSSRNNGLLIKVGHGTYNSNNRSSFVEFESADGDYCGRIRQTGNASVSFQNTSDIRLKENIQPTQYGLNDILKIEVRDYNYISDAKNNQHTGFIAQQLHTVFPVVVEKGGEDAKTNPWTVDYAGMTPLLVKGIQDQQKIIEELKIENEKLKMINEKYNKQFQQLEHLSRDLVEQNAEMKAMLEQIQAQLNNQNQ